VVDFLVMRNTAEKLQTADEVWLYPSKPLQIFVKISLKKCYQA